MKKIKYFLFLLCVSVTMSCCTGKAYASGIINSRPSSEITAVNAKQIEFTDGVSRITAGGRYILSGEHEGQILIEASRSDDVEIILNGAVLNNPKGQAIFAPRSRGVELILSDGTINFISDGVHSDGENNAAIFVRHDLIISGSGTLNVSGNFHHGIRAQDFLTINGGVFHITAEGDALRGRDGVIINDGVFFLTAGGDGIQSNNSSNPDYGFITINGGVFDITAGDDGIQAETNITINGGSIQIKAADDGITANKSVLITDGSINILESYEGIEGLNVTITGGNINVIARDDGINARDSNAVRDFRGRPMMRGPLNQDIFVRITGGSVYVHALGDGIDSNNNIFIEGGNIYISGPSRGMEGAIDCDGSLLITGGRLITAGSVINISRQSTQPVVSVAFSRQLPAGTLVEVKNSKDNILLNYTAQTAFSASFFTSSDFVTGETYALFINGEKTNDITLNTLITSVSGNSALAGEIPRGNNRNIPGAEFIPPGDFGGRFGEMPNPEDFRNMPNPGDFGRNRRDMPPRP